MTAAMRMVSDIFSASSAKPGAMMKRTSHGMASSMTMVMRRSAEKSTPKTSSEKRLAPSTPLASISFENSGTKAALKAPSANSRRNRFGKRKAA
ncbi:hypothetical protein D3C86_1915350 [compost metagenome]